MPNRTSKTEIKDSQVDFEQIENLVSRSDEQTGNQQNSLSTSEQKVAPSQLPNVNNSSDHDDQKFNIVCKEEKSPNYCGNYIKSTKSITVDWRKLTRVNPYYIEKEDKYYVSYDVVSDSLSEVKKSVETNKQEILSIITNTFNLKVNPSIQYNISSLVKNEDIYYEPRDYKPSKILYSISGTDLFQITSIDENSGLLETSEFISGLTVVKQQTFKIEDFYDALTTLKKSLDKFALNYELWNFANGQKQQGLINSPSSSGKPYPTLNLNDVSQDTKRFKNVRTAFTTLLGKNGISLSSDPQAKIIISYGLANPADTEAVPEIVSIRVKTPSRPATELVWYYGSDPIGGLKNEDCIKNNTIRNYLFNLDNIDREIKTISWDKFLSTYRNPAIILEEASIGKAITGRGLNALKNFSEQAFDKIVADLQEADFKFSLFAEKYNKQFPNLKSLNQKIAQDAELEKLNEKISRGSIVSEAVVITGDPFASALTDTLNLGFKFGKTSSDSQAKKTGEKYNVPRMVLGTLGENFMKFSGLLAISVAARSVPVEKIRELNIKEKIKKLNPMDILENTIEDAIAKLETGTQEEIEKSLKFIGPVITGILNNASFDQRTLSALESHIEEAEVKVPQSDPTNLKGQDLKNFRAGLVEYGKSIAQQSGQVYNTPVPATVPTPDAVSTINFAFALSTFLKDGKVNIDLDLITKNLKDEIISVFPISELPNTLSQKFDELNTDVEDLFSTLESCGLPDTEVFKKYKDYGRTLTEFFKGFKKISMPKFKKVKIPDLKKVFAGIIGTLAINLYYVAITSIIQTILGFINELTLNLDCEQFSVLISNELNNRGTTPLRNGSDAPQPMNVDLATRIIENLKAVSPNSQQLTEDEVVQILFDISETVGLYKGTDLEILNDFVFILSSVLTDREFCSLLTGTPIPDAIKITQNLITVRFKDSGLSTDEQDIKKFFSSIGSLVGPICYAKPETGTKASVPNTQGDIPVNTILCSRPTDYEAYIGTRRQLLSYRNSDLGVSNEEINMQIDQMCEISKSTIVDMLDFINSEDPLAEYYDSLLSPLSKCGSNESIPGITNEILSQIEPSYENLISSLEMIFIEETVGGNGLLNNVLANKAGVAYPGYLALESIFGSSGSDGAVQFPSIQKNPYYIASWMRKNCVLLGSTEQYKERNYPLIVNKSSNSSDYSKLLSIDPKRTSTYPTYEQLFEIAGSNNSGIRTISYCGIENRKSSKAEDIVQPENRIKAYNFFIIPHNGVLTQNPSSLSTTIIDYRPLSVSITKPDCNNNTTSAIVPSSAESKYSTIHKSFEIISLTKNETDYRLDLRSNAIFNGPTLNNLQDRSSVSNQSFVFTEIVLKGMQNSGKNISSLSSSIIEYLNKSCFNHVFNSFLDGIIKIPTSNEKNLTYGFTDRRINLLNSTHTNTITGAPAPVEAEKFGGTEESPTIYFYNALDDTMINHFNLIVNDANSAFAPVKKQIPDLASIPKNISNLYLYFPIEDRESSDLSNQTPFDLIIPKSSMAAAQGIIDASILVYAYENYVKGFSIFNTMETTSCNYDETLFKYLAEKFKDIIKKSAPSKNGMIVGFEDTNMDDKEIHYFQFLEIMTNLFMKKRDSNLIELTDRQGEILSSIERKMNIWQFGLPSADLSLEETQYFNAMSEISKLEMVNYPIGPIGTAMLNGATGPMLSSMADILASKRQTQIKLRNYYWSLIMKDCEDLCIELLADNIKESFISISNQMSVLNPSLTRLSDSLLTPFVGGPLLQADYLNAPNNRFTQFPTFLCSRGIIPSIEQDYGSKPDYNFNGFVLLDNNTIINDGAIEVACPVDTSNLVANTVNYAATSNIEKAVFDAAYQMNSNFLKRRRITEDTLLNEQAQYFDPSKTNIDDLISVSAYRKFSNDYTVTQNIIPFVVEQYLYLVPYEKASLSPQPEVCEVLYEYLYSGEASKLGFVFREITSFKILSNFLNSSGFFEDSRIAQVNLKSLSFRQMFSECKTGLRLNILLNDSPPIALTTEEINELNTKRKVLFRETGYSIPIFSDEEVISDLVSLRQVKNFATNESAYLAFNRSNNIRHISNIIEDDNYKLMFDYCIPLRYFNSLSAIYSIKAFIPSIGSTADWEGKIVNNSSKTGINSVDPDFSFPEFQKTIGILINECANSYDMRNNLGTKAPVEIQPVSNKLSSIGRTIKSSPTSNCTNTNSTEIDLVEKQLNEDITSFNSLSRDKKEKLFTDLYSGIPGEFPASYKARVIKDPTNAYGFAGTGMSGSN